MLPNVLSNLFSRPATRPFPAERREPPAGARGTVAFEVANCIYCGACALRCPSHAIEVSRADRTLTFDLFRCIACGCCAEACKKQGVHMDPQYHGPVYEHAVVVHRTEAPPKNGNGTR